MQGQPCIQEIKDNCPLVHHQYDEVPTSKYTCGQENIQNTERFLFHRIEVGDSPLGVDAFWEIKESPLEMTYKPTGQKIYFRGLDDPLKVTSITVDIGCLCWMWIEEAYEISSEDDFNMLDESTVVLSRKVQDCSNK